MRIRVVALLGGLVVACSSVDAQGPCDFPRVTQLANGALAGQNVNTPVPGFELLLMRDGEVVYHRAFGIWTIGRIANADSATKTISGAVVMSLVDSSPQPFSLDTRLSQYIPQFTGLKTNITIRQAFSHTTNLRDSSVVGSDTVTLQQAALDIADDPIQCFQGLCQPGTYFNYGGTSMHAAGAVAEAAAGVSWNTLFQQRIRGPLDMNETTYTLSSPSNPRIGGGCETTATDFAKLMDMLRRNGTAMVNGIEVQVLTPQAVASMLTRQSPVGVPIMQTPVQSPFVDGADYGVGIWLDERNASGTLLGALAAGARGFSSWIDIDDNMVGVFGTDLSASGNVQGLLYLLRAAAQEEMRACDAGACDSIDFNNDSSLFDPHDIDAFLSVYSEGPCIPASATCNDIDFNNDGSLFDPCDIDSFLLQFAEGPCTPCGG